MFITQAFKKETDFSLIVLDFLKYLIGSIIVFFASLFGQIPLGIAILFSGKTPNSESDIYKLF